MDHRRPLTPTPERLDDERAVMGRTAGCLWLLVGALMLAGLLLPRTEIVHWPWTLGVGLYAMAYGIGSVTGLIPWERLPMWQHRLALYVVPPLAVLMQWSTGGSASYMYSVLPLVTFFAAYFFGPRMTFTVVGLMLAGMAAPLLYDGDALANAFLARLVSVDAACLVLAGVTLWLKSRLVRAELVQRAMALRDPLTGAANRRAFDIALAREVDGLPASGASALLFVDLDRFKLINDRFGHPTGDRVLIDMAQALGRVIRPGDTLARIGGDEFAVIAPRAGGDGAERLAAALRAAARTVDRPPGGAGLAATVSTAVLDEDGPDAADLMRAADARLHDAKRTRGRQVPVTPIP